MKFHNHANKILWGLVCVSLALTIFLTVRVTAASGGAPKAPSIITPKLHYQGRLLDPTTGVPKIDGNYTMIFNIYNVASGGAPLWTETKDVAVSKGIFSTLLGDTTPLNTSIFNGQDLWLGISVGADPQMTPRQPLAYVPYAIYANNAGTLDGHQASYFALANHTHSALPQAFGYISQYTPLLRPGSYGVDSAVWSSTYSRFEITLTNFYYSIDDITVATLLGDAGSCPAGATIRTSSVSGKLLVYVVNSAGTHIQCSFNFVTFAGQ
jgi:hypothetical protein